MKKSELFSILDTVAKGIADTFGTSCETLIQDLDTTDHPILSIYNGAVSGRRAGSCTDIFGTVTDSSIDMERLRQPHINMLAARDGRTIKSTTLPFFAEDGVLGLGINFDCTDLALASQVLKELTSINGFLREDLRRNRQPQIDTLFQDAIRAFDFNPMTLTKSERHGLLLRLQTDHFFEQQRAVPYLAEHLGVSRYTIYKDLKELHIQSDPVA